jgi:ATP-dependent DNA helicase
MAPARSLAVIRTSFDMAIKDSKYLRGFLWKYIVVDEGHRLKNMDCLLIRELKTFSSANRLILTGTPLHNNLSELWSLLNFILPDIFDDLESCEPWWVVRPGA